MSNHHHPDRLRALGTLFATASLLAACGGDSSPPPPPPPPPPSGFSITGRAVDGPLQGATACLDTNDNGACDATEPTSGATTADGAFTISVASAAQAGAHRVIVNVPATAVDADTGTAVGTAFTLVAPASGTSGSQSVFVSPLTTLVQQQMELSGQTRTQAAAYIQQQAGLAVSPLADFTANTNADNTRAANVAKLVLKTTIQQAAEVAGAVGQTDVSGAPITQAELDRAVTAQVIGALPVIGAAAADPAVAGLTGSAREVALGNSAAQVVAGTGFTPAQARFVIGVPKIPQPAATAPAAGANMPSLQYVDGSNWFFRYNGSTAADNTPDANGLLRYYSVRTRMAPYAFLPTEGVAESYGRTPNPELHWSGTEWTTCSITDRSSSTQRDALGRASYDFCRNHEKGVSQRASVDISGQPMAQVWTDRILVEQAKTNNPTAWQLSAAGLSLLGTASFPAGSQLSYQTNTITETAITYNTSTTNQVGVFSAGAAAGGDARTGSPECASAAPSSPAITLEGMVGGYPGRPCIFGQQTNDANGLSLDPNETWGLSTLSMGTLATNVARPAGTGTYYTTNRLLRVSFPSTGNTVYWSCLQRTVGNTARNCTQIGSGTYSVSAVGDARVMTFNNLPASAQAMSTTRVFVERGGQIYFGFKNRVGRLDTTVRLNLVAANALLGQLQMPAIQPADAPQPLTGSKASNAALVHGVWGLVDANGAAVIRFGPGGQYLMAQASPPDSAGRSGLERGHVDFDLAATHQVGLSLEVDSNNQWGFSHPLPNDRIVSISDTAIDAGGTVINRLQDDPNGIVGMWALGSATDFKVTHFVFFANGKALSIHPAETQGPCATSRQGPPGVEWSDYSFNAATGLLTFSNRSIDTSGCTGIWDATDPAAPSSVSLTITLAADRQTFTVDGTTAYRITPNP